MKLVRVNFHNYRSICEDLSECSLSADPRITTLIGSSESGKSNLLQAMAKFESGAFDDYDVPRMLISGTKVTPDNDMPILSATYQLEPLDIEKFEGRLPPGIDDKNQITLRRNFKGPIYAADVEPTDRPLSDVATDLYELLEEFEEAVPRFLRAYSRQRRNWSRQDLPETRVTTLRLWRFLESLSESLNEGTFDSPRPVQEIQRRHHSFALSWHRLDKDLVGYVPDRTKSPAQAAISSMTSLIEELVSHNEDSIDDWLIRRPRFSLVSSDPLEWLQEEYEAETLLAIAGNEQDTSSVALLLELAGLNFQIIQDAPERLVPDLLVVASKTASDKLDKYWSQDKVGIKFSLSRAQNLIIYVETEDHTGVPSQRSNGFRWYLEFLLRYTHARESGEPTILLFDEPGIYLHPAAQEDLKRLLRTEIGSHMQVILTTHLPGMIDTAALDSLRGVVKNDQGKPGTWIINEEYSPEHRKITWDVMRKAIGAHGSDGQAQGRVAVLEGISDQQYLIGVARLLAKDEDQRAYEIAGGSVRLRPGFGAKSITPICQGLLEEQSTFIVLLDSDEAGNQLKRSLEAKYHPPEEHFRGVLQVLDIDYGGGFAQAGSEHESEDLFGAEIYSEMVNHVFSDRIGGAKPFKPPVASPPSMLKKSALSWLDSIGVPPDQIYLVPQRFNEMLETGVVVLSKDVRDRFAILLEQISISARAPWAPAA